MPLQYLNSIVNTAPSPESAQWTDLAPVPATASAPPPPPPPALAPAPTDIDVIAHTSIIRFSQLSDPPSEMKHIQ